VDFIAPMADERRMWVYAKEKKEWKREEKKRKGQGTTY